MGTIDHDSADDVEVEIVDTNDNTQNKRKELRERLHNERMSRRGKKGSKTVEWSASLIALVPEQVNNFAIVRILKSQITNEIEESHNWLTSGMYSNGAHSPEEMVHYHILETAHNEDIPIKYLFIAKISQGWLYFNNGNIDIPAKSPFYTAPTLNFGKS